MYCFEILTKKHLVVATISVNICSKLYGASASQHSGAAKQVVLTVWSGHNQNKKSKA